MKCTICSTTENVKEITHLPYPEGRRGWVTLAEYTPYCAKCANEQGAIYAKQMDELLKSRQ